VYKIQISQLINEHRPDSLTRRGRRKRRKKKVLEGSGDGIIKR
jgi:hypothetical protein